jgi:hypothetical protein
VRENKLKQAEISRNMTSRKEPLSVRARHQKLKPPAYFLLHVVPFSLPNIFFLLINDVLLPTSPFFLVPQQKGSTVVLMEFDRDLAETNLPPQN